MALFWRPNTSATPSPHSSANAQLCTSCPAGTAPSPDGRQLPPLPGSSDLSAFQPYLPAVTVVAPRTLQQLSRSQHSPSPSPRAAAPHSPPLSKIESPLTSLTASSALAKILLTLGLTAAMEKTAGEEEKDRLNETRTCGGAWGQLGRAGRLLAELTRDRTVRRGRKASDMVGEPSFWRGRSWGRGESRLQEGR